MGMARLTHLAWLTFVVGWPSALLAQDTLTLSQAVQETVARNRSFQAAQASVRDERSASTKNKASTTRTCCR